MNPALAFAELIEANLLNTGYTVFVNHAPDQPDNVILIYEIGRGRMEERRMRTGITDQHPLLHVMVRGQDSSARAILESIGGITDAAYDFALSNGQKLRVITKSNTIGFAGQEQQTRRYLYTQQFRLTLE
jgi:hypothetical protein